jgi:hypothetical protein
VFQQLISLINPTDNFYSVRYSLERHLVQQLGLIGPKTTKEVLEFVERLKRPPQRKKFDVAVIFRGEISTVFRILCEKKSRGRAGR